MEQKRSTFIGYAKSVVGNVLLSALLTFPACDLAKPLNKHTETQIVVPVTEIVQISEKPIATEIKTTEPSPKTISPEPQTAAAVPTQQKPVQPEQLPPGWTPEKMAVVEQLKKDLTKFPGRCAGESGLENLDPILVGRNIVFVDKWLNLIGTNKPLSKQQFEQWRNRVDKVYDSYAELVGKSPAKGEKVLVDLQPARNFPASTHGHAHNGSNVICINYQTKSFKTVLQEIASHNSSEHTLMHEIAHLFADRTKWEIEQESLVDLLISYAMETNPELQYGGLSKNLSIGWQKTIGNQHRLRRYHRTLGMSKSKNIKTFNENGGKSVYDMYLLGLVDKVGWDTYKKVFRSYNDENFVKPKEYLNNTKIARARDFFDRIEYFSGKPNVLRSLPDKGELLDRNLNAILKPQSPTKKTASLP